MEDNKVNQPETFAEFAGQESPIDKEIQATDKSIAITKELLKSQTTQVIPKPRVEAGESGVLMPRDFEGAYRMATILCDSKTLPSSFDTPAKVFAAMQLAYELGLTPMVALRQMMVLNGTPTIFGDLPLSLALRSGKLKEIREWWFDKDGQVISPENNNTSAEVFGSTCIVERVGLSPVTRTFTMADAQKANLTGKGPWKSYPKRMLQCRTRAWALKDRFADVLNGVSILEYDHNTLATAYDQAGSLTATEPDDKAASLNSRFGKLANKETIEVDASKESKTIDL